MVQNDPFIAPWCPVCQLPYRTDTTYEYPCSHVICPTCYSGKDVCPACGYSGSAVYSKLWQGVSTDWANNTLGPVCESCEDTASFYCTTCPQLLCERCSFIHRRPTQRRDHRVEPLPEHPPASQLCHDELVSTRSSNEYPVNYDIPEHVYLPRKSGRSDSDSSSGKRVNCSADSNEQHKNPRPKKHKKDNEKKVSDNWNRTSESRKPFRKNPPVRIFNYSVSSRSSSVTSLINLSDAEKPVVDLTLKKNASFGNISLNSQKSEMSEKSVGTDLSGGASMISNTSYTIMVYANALPGTSTDSKLMDNALSLPVTSADIKDKIVKTSTPRDIDTPAIKDPNISALDDMDNSEIEVDVDSGEYVKSSPIGDTNFPKIDDNNSFLLQSEPPIFTAPITPQSSYTKICFTKDESDDDSCHNHGMYIARKANSLSSSSSISYCSHTCDSHYTKSERSWRVNDRDGSLDGISDIYNNTSNQNETDVSYVCSEGSCPKKSEHEYAASCSSSRSFLSDHSTQSGNHKCESCQSASIAKSNRDSFEDDGHVDTLERLYKSLHGGGSEPRISSRSSKSSSSRSRQSITALGEPDKPIPLQAEALSMSSHSSLTSHELDFEAPSTSFMELSNQEFGSTTSSKSEVSSDIHVEEVTLDPLENTSPGARMEDKVNKLRAEVFAKREDSEKHDSEKEIATSSGSTRPKGLYHPEKPQEYKEDVSNEPKHRPRSATSITSNDSSHDTNSNHRLSDQDSLTYSNEAVKNDPEIESVSNLIEKYNDHTNYPTNSVTSSMSSINSTNSKTNVFGYTLDMIPSAKSNSVERPNSAERSPSGRSDSAEPSSSAKSSSSSGSSKGRESGIQRPSSSIKRDDSTSTMSQSSNESFGRMPKIPSESRIARPISRSLINNSKENLTDSESPKLVRKCNSVNKLIEKYNKSSESFDKDSSASDDQDEGPCMLPNRSSTSNSSGGSAARYDLKSYISSEDHDYLTHSSNYDSDEDKFIEENEEEDDIQFGLYDCGERIAVLEHLSEVEETVESDGGLDAETCSNSSKHSDVNVIEEYIEVIESIPPGNTMANKVSKLNSSSQTSETNDRSRYKQDLETESITIARSNILRMSDCSTKSSKSGRSSKNYKRGSLTKTISFESSSSENTQEDEKTSDYEKLLFEKEKQKAEECVTKGDLSLHEPHRAFDVGVDAASDVSSNCGEDSYIRDLIINNELTEVEDNNHPQSAANILHNRVMQGQHTKTGENLAFMDNLSNTSLTPVSSVVKVDEDKNAGLKQEAGSDKDTPISDVSSQVSITSSCLDRLQHEPLASKIGKYSEKPMRVVIGDNNKINSADEDVLYFPTFGDYMAWSMNQERTCYTPSESENEIEDVKRRYSSNSDNMSVRDAMKLYIYDKDPDNLNNPDEFKMSYERSIVDNKMKNHVTEDGYDMVVEENRRKICLLVEDIPDNDITVDSSYYNPENGAMNIDAVSLDEDYNLYSNSDSSGTMTPTECHDLDYFEQIPADKAILVNAGPPETYQVRRGSSDNLPRANSEVSMSDSMLSSTGASNHCLSVYVDEFNGLMENDSGFPDNSPSPISSNERYIDLVTDDTFTRKYSKRVSALARKPAIKSHTLPRNIKSRNNENSLEKSSKTLPRKRNQSGDRLTGFLNTTYGGKALHPKNKSSRDTILSSRSFGSIADYQKFGDGSLDIGLDYNTRTLPRHLGRKPQLRCPSMRQVDWSVMGKKGTEPGYLMNPAGITVDEGCVAICEEGNKRIQVFINDESAMCIENLANPCGVALSSNNIFVTDIDANVVKVYTREGEDRGTIGMPGSQRGMFNEPRGITRSYNGDIAVCDTENHRVQIFNSDSLFVKSIGIKGKEPGQFREPIGCSFDRWGRLLISDHCNYRVQIFDNNYQYISDFGKYGKRSGEFWGVNGICSHSNGDVLVVDSDNNCLSVHSSDGRFISVFGRKGEDRWEFLFPHSVTSDEFGNVYVSDWGNHRIHVMDKKLLPYLELESHML